MRIEKKSFLKTKAALAGLVVASMLSGCGMKQPEGEIQGLTGVALSVERWRSGLERKTIEVDGYTIPYLDGGEGEALILVHGFGANKDNFTRIGGLLTKKMRVIVPDLPGFGATERRPNDDFSIDKQAERVHALAQKLGIKTYHVGGNSMGGWIAGIAATKYPEQIQSVWFLNPAGTKAGGNSEVLKHYRDTGESLLTVSSREQYERLLDYIFTKRPSPMPSFVIDAMSEKAIADKPLNDKIYKIIRETPSDMPERLQAAGFQKPALIVWGDNDRVLHVDGAAELAASLPQAKVVVMKQMGHAPMIERPEETAADYLKFRKL